MFGLNSERAVSLDKFRSHAQSEAHLEAVCKLTGCEKCFGQLDALTSSRMAPSEREFREVWDARLRGAPLTHLSGSAGRNKATSMQHVLSTAAQLQEQQALLNAVTLCTHIDGKGKRYVGSTPLVFESPPLGAPFREQ